MQGAMSPAPRQIYGCCKRARANNVRPYVPFPTVFSPIFSLLSSLFSLLSPHCNLYTASISVSTSLKCSSIEQ